MVTRDLLEARKAGVVLGVTDEGKLSVYSPHMPPSSPLMKKLHQNKDAILEFYGNLETKLRDGQQWLIKAEKKMWEKDGSPTKSAKKLHVFKRNMFAWDDLDSLVEPRRCPIGTEGCHPESVVICRTCGNK